MMLSSSFVCIATLLALSDAFAPLSVPTKQASCALNGVKSPWDSVSNLEQLEGQYQELWENTRDLLIKEKAIKGSRDVAETMLETALKAVALQRYKHQEIIDIAKRHGKEAIQERHFNEAIEREATEGAEQAQWEVDMLESIDASYEDLERLRESSRLHAAEHLKHDTHEIAVEDAFVELEAEAVVEEATAVLDRIAEYEAKLKSSLKEVNDMKMEDMRKGWENPEP